MPLNDLIRRAGQETIVPPMSFAEAMQVLYDLRYTGRIPMDFKDGRVVFVNIPSGEVKVRVDKPDTVGAR